MSTNFIQRRRIQKYLIVLFVVVVIITILVVWQGFFVKRKPSEGEEKTRIHKKLEIDFQLLESPILEKLQSFTGIPVSEEEMGRDNPFLTY